MTQLPKHLERYVVTQNYDRYTPVDQAVWRHIMRQLKSFLSVHAHACYTDGLKKTGIEIDRIPRIDVMNEKLEKFGWRAVPVSGFIPPAAFMELQSLGVLPIACDMRSVDHLLYTPAPDIVHEAAGHAPILVDPAFAHYLKSYAMVARKAILSKEDIDQYEAIRILSDIKEYPGSTAAQIQQSEDRLAQVTASMKTTSEAAILGRMNWWTAEYGLIGSLESPKIFGAGLLSSVGESRSAISSKVKKIPLSLDCINYAYDITEQQPQLFVAPSFEKLSEILDELSLTMAYRRGGIESLEKAVRAQTVNTVELDSGLQISGILKKYLSGVSKNSVETKAAYLSFEGPAQLALKGQEIKGQGVEHHHHGFGSPVGRVDVESKMGRTGLTDLSKLSSTELSKIGIVAAGSGSSETVTLHFESGVVVRGNITKLTFNSEQRLVILTLNQAKAVRGDEVLFDPSWGIYDMAVGTEVTSVYGGPADRPRFGETDDFTKKTVPPRTYEDSTLKRHALFGKVRDSRESETNVDLTRLTADALSSAGDDWLLLTEILELIELTGRRSKNATSSHDTATLAEKVSRHLAEISKAGGTPALHIQDALKTLHGA